MNETFPGAGEFVIWFKRNYLYGIGSDTAETRDCEEKMRFYLHKPRQAFGLVYILIYLSIFFIFAFLRRDDQSWTIESKFAVAVILWFILSLAVKVSMLMNRTIELLNLVAMVAFMAIGFTYNPQPDHISSIENFCYYLNMMGGSACDLFDFVYSGAARGSEDPLAGRER